MCIHMHKTRTHPYKYPHASACERESAFRERPSWTACAGINLCLLGSTCLSSALIAMLITLVTYGGRLCSKHLSYITLFSLVR